MAEAEDKTRGSSTRNEIDPPVYGRERGLNEEQKNDYYNTINDSRWEEEKWRGAQKAMPDMHIGSQFEGSHQEYTKERTPPSLPKATDKDLGLMNLVSKMKDPAEFFKTVVDVVKSVENCDVTQKDWILLGYDYRQGKYAEFLIAQYEVGENTKIDFKRMCGDGFLMSEFYTEVKNLLKLKDAVVADKEPEVDFKYSDDEDSGDNDEDHLAYGYLHLAYEPKIVNTWLRKIKTRHIEDQLHLLGILAHNASNKENLDIIVQQGGEKLAQLFFDKMENSNIAALVYYTSLLAKHVTGHPENSEFRDAYDQKLLAAVFECMKFWVPGKQKSSKNRHSTTKFEVTESRETIKNLIEVVYNLGEVMEAFTMEEIVATAKSVLVKQKTKKATQRDDVLRFLKTQGDGKPVLYLKNILQQITI